MLLCVFVCLLSTTHVILISANCTKNETLNCQTLCWVISSCGKFFVVLLLTFHSFRSSFALDHTINFKLPRLLPRSPFSFNHTVLFRYSVTLVSVLYHNFLSSSLSCHYSSINIVVSLFAIAYCHPLSYLYAHNRSYLKLWFTFLSSQATSRFALCIGVILYATTNGTNFVDGQCKTLLAFTATGMLEILHFFPVLTDRSTLIFPRSVLTLRNQTVRRIFCLRCFHLLVLLSRTL